MKSLEESVRAIEKDGLVWGASKLVPVGFGIKKYVHFCGNSPGLRILTA